MSSLSIKARAARALLSLGEAFGKDVGAGRILIRQKVSQGDLAAMAGIARENLSRILQDWMDAKLVSRLAGYYCLENKATLERAADAWTPPRLRRKDVPEIRPRAMFRMIALDRIGVPVERSARGRGNGCNRENASAGA